MRLNYAKLASVAGKTRTEVRNVVQEDIKLSHDSLLKKI